jgi:hypothetical protein
MSSDWRLRSGKWTGRWRLPHNWGWPRRTAMSLQPSMATPSCTSFRVRLCGFGWLILCEQQQTVPSPKVKQPRKPSWPLKISRTVKLGKVSWIHNLFLIVYNFLETFFCAAYLVSYMRFACDMLAQTHVIYLPWILTKRTTNSVERNLLLLKCNNNTGNVHITWHWGAFA